MVENTSINEDSKILLEKNEAVEKKEEEMNLTDNPLVEKTILKLGGKGTEEKAKSIKESFRTEIAVLKNLRNAYSNYIASYYF